LVSTRDGVTLSERTSPAWSCCGVFWLSCQSNRTSWKYTKMALCPALPHLFSFLLLLQENEKKVDEHAIQRGQIQTTPVSYVDPISTTTTRIRPLRLWFQRPSSPRQISPPLRAPLRFAFGDSPHRQSRSSSPPRLLRDWGSSGAWRSRHISDESKRTKERTGTPLVRGTWDVGTWRPVS
jgi:hypothetical protein